MDSLIFNLQRQGRNFFIVQGVLGLLAGLAIIVWPNASLAVIAWVVAIWLAIDGLLAIASWLRQKTAYKAGLVPFPPTVIGVFRGVTQLILSLLIALAPTVFAALLLFFMSGLAFVVGVVNLMLALSLRRLGVSQWWGFLIVALVALGVGILMVTFPRESITSILWVVGAMAIVQGVACIGFGLRLNSSLTQTEKRASYENFDGTIEGEIVEERHWGRRSVEGEIIDDDDPKNPGQRG